MRGNPKRGRGAVKEKNWQGSAHITHHPGQLLPVRDMRTKAQRGKGTCPWSRSKATGTVRLDSRYLVCDWDASKRAGEKEEKDSHEASRKEKTARGRQEPEDGSGLLLSNGNQSTLS